MAYNGSGTYIIVNNSFGIPIDGTAIDSSDWTAVYADIASALSTCILKDGTTSITSDLKMNGFNHTNVDNAGALTEYASADDVVDFTLQYAGASAAGTDTYAASLPVSPGAYKVGQLYAFLTDVANTGACTLNLNTIGAADIKLPNGNDPETGDIQATSMVIVQYDGTSFQLMNPAFAGLSASQFLRSDANTVATGNITITNGAPQVIQVETGVTADNSTWRAYPNAESYIFDIANDAFTASSQWLQIDRTGTTVDQAILSCNIINLAALSAVQINGVDIESNATQLSYNNITTLGTVEASKTVTADGSGDVNFPSGTSLQVEGNTLKGFHAFLVSGTTMTPAVAGWSVTNPATGNYTITTPTTNAFDCRLITVSVNGSSLFGVIRSATSTSTLIRIYDETGALTNSSFNFMLIRNN